MPAQSCAHISIHCTVLLVLFTFHWTVKCKVQSMGDEQEIMCKLESIKEIRYCVYGRSAGDSLLHGHYRCFRRNSDNRRRSLDESDWKSAGGRVVQQVLQPACGYNGGRGAIPHWGSLAVRMDLRTAITCRSDPFDHPGLLSLFSRFMTDQGARTMSPNQRSGLSVQCGQVRSPFISMDVGHKSHLISSCWPPT